MLGFGSATRVYVAIGATDMRKGFEGLFGIVRDRLMIDPLSGHVFVFCKDLEINTEFCLVMSRVEFRRHYAAAA